jgi:hypothetical protein
MAYKFEGRSGGGSAGKFSLWTLLLLCVTASGLAAGSEDSVAVMENKSVRIEFALGAGIYNVTTLPDKRRVIGSAHATVEDWNSTDRGCTGKVIEKNGGRLLIESSRPDGPALLLEFTLHEGWIELRSGLKNTTGKAVRIKTFRPLAHGDVFYGTKWTDVRTLNAPSGANQTKVTVGAVCDSANDLLLTFKESGVRRSLVLGALKTADFSKFARTGQEGGVVAELEGRDPVGKLVEPGETYLPEDSFYVGAGTPNPFEALEQYGRELRQATGARPNPYDFPTVCAWYAGVWKTKGAQNHPEKSSYKINTSSGLVEEADKMGASGFLNASRAAGRLVPDNYTAINPQGWWDDAHWQSQGFYTAPYETSAKFGEGMHRRGTLAFTYIQPSNGMIPPLSRDFVEQHVSWMCGRDAKRTLDFSQPEVQGYLREKFGALRGSIDGLMVDYCDELWLKDAGHGGFADPHMTAATYYRTFFQCVKEGLGPGSWLHERIIIHPDNDLNLGIADSQRTSSDTDKISPDLVSRSGLRWYKNRVVLGYDMDSKELGSAWKIKGWTGTDQDGRRMLLTMAYVAASRLLLADSFRDLAPEVVHDLERTFPYPTEPRSARPVDAFTNAGWPRVYDYAVNVDWHQVTLFNNSLPTREETIAVPMAGDTADGALGLAPGENYYVYDFWNERFVGKLSGAGILKETLRPGEARMLSIRKVEKHPQVLSTNRHIMQGCLDLSDVKWSGNTLSGKAKLIGGEPFKIVIALNGYRAENLEAAPGNSVGVCTIERPQSGTVEWSVKFTASNPGSAE